ncbi:MAG TPA: hypothetical protein VG755_31650 [Nannocystaceae bacterium]|nr:hypothetical protein [Nannocystaceae bacterium]
MRAWTRASCCSALMGAAALALGLSACGSELDGLCPARGCEGGAKLAIHRVQPHASASYIFTLTTERDRYAWRCEILDGAPCNNQTHLPQDYKDDDEGWRLSFWSDDATALRIWTLGFRDDWMIGPESLTLRITESDDVLFEQSWTPEYSRRKASPGPECGGCAAWETEVELYDGPTRDDG